MRTAALIAICLVGFFASGTAGAAEGGAVSIRVLWTVSGYVLGPHAVWGEREAKAQLFKPLDISETAIAFDGLACKAVHFQRSMAAASGYFQERWQVTPERLTVADRQVEVVKTDCQIEGFQEFVRLRDNRLIVPIKGVFFFFDPAYAQTPPHRI